MTPNVLTIAGTDPSGGAGIQADLKTFTANDCYGTSVITALTAQNTTGVKAVHACPPEFVAQQLDAVLDDISIHAVKTGMLYDAATIRVVVRALKAHADQMDLIVDPVMVSTSGHTLLESAAIITLRSDLLPLATIVTPNIPEAELLLSSSPSEEYKITSISEMVEAASRISSQLGPKSVLLKGGHLKVTRQDFETARGTSSVEYAAVCDPSYPQLLRAVDPAAYEAISSGSVVVDVLYDSVAESPNQFTFFVRPRIDSRSTHGTGCTLSAALACEFARGKSVLDAVRNATAYTHLGISTAKPIGKGHGPLNHMHPLISRVLPMPTLDSPYPFVSALIKATQTEWNKYVQHPFVIQLGEGTLSRDSFVHFIKQDYHYLKHYARAHGMLAAKANSFLAIESSAQIMFHIARESTMHTSFCAKWGVSMEELVVTPESTATTAYALYILDTGLKGDDLSLIVALAACLLGYGEVGLWLAAECAQPESSFILEGNPYRQWIESYSGEEYQTACRVGIHALESRMAADPPSAAKFKELSGIWGQCVRLEKGFWDMAMALA